MWWKRPVKIVEVEVPLRRTTVYGGIGGYGPFFLTPEACINKHGSASPFSAFKSDGAWYFAGRLVRMDVRENEDDSSD